MSARTITAVQRFLSPETRDAIRQAGVEFDAETLSMNIEHAFRSRGEHALADRMLSEVETGLQEHMLERLSATEREPTPEHVGASVAPESLIDRLDQIAQTPVPTFDPWEGFRATTAEEARENLIVARIYPEYHQPQGPKSRVPPVVGSLTFETAALVALEINQKRMSGRKTARWMAITPDGNRYRVIDLNPNRYSKGDWSPLCPRDFPAEGVIRSGLDHCEASTLTHALNKELRTISRTPRFWYVIVVPLMLSLEAPAKSKPAATL